MFDSGIGALEFVDDIKKEVDIEIAIPLNSYTRWVNALEQLLYGEIIKEQRVFDLEIDSPENQSEQVNKISLTKLDGDEDADNIRFEDIHAVYADDTQLIKSTAASGVIFPNAYYKSGNDLGLNINNDVKKIKIVYFVRPKTDWTFSKNIMVPLEFIGMVGAKLRGEAYKIANEDALSAKWLNDYNVALEDFKVWILSKQPEFGI